jgi:hypothetical protein
MSVLSRSLGRVTRALRPHDPGKHRRTEPAPQHTSPPPVSVWDAPRRTPRPLLNPPLVRPYVLVVAEARRNGAVSW